MQAKQDYYQKCRSADRLEEAVAKAGRKAEDVRLYSLEVMIWDSLLNGPHNAVFLIGVNTLPPIAISFSL